MGADMLKIRRTLLDRAIGYISPRAEAERLRYRAGVEMLTAMGGGYEGASRSNRAFQGWATREMTADQATLPALGVLRQRTRDLDRNNPIAVGAVSTIATNVVGTGLMCLPSVDAAYIRARLGWNEQQVEDWQQEADRLWRLASETAAIDAGLLLDFYSMQDIMLREVLVAGDVFMLRLYEERAGNPFGTMLQLVPAERVCNPNGAMDTASLAGGVEVDANGAAVRYHFRDGDIQSGWRWSARPAFAANGSRVCWHIYKPTMLRQRRGVPVLAAVIEVIRQLGTYTKAEIMAAVVNSCFAITTKTPEGDGSAGLDPTADEGGSSPAAKPSLAFTESGMILDLLPNEEVASFSPARPNTNFEPFFQAMVRQIGVSLDIPFSVLMKAFQSSYSASKGELELAWQAFRTRRSWLVRSACAPVREAFLAEAVARDMLPTPGFFTDPLLRAAFLRSVWIGPSQPILDEVKAATAAEKRIDAELSTRGQEAAARGLDWRQIHDERVREENLRRRDGTAAPAPGAAPVPPADAAAGDGDEEDEE